jgi:hypothetical protein
VSHGHTTDVTLVPLVHLGCVTCGIPFAVPRHFFDAVVEHARSITCPNGHQAKLGVPSPKDQYIHELRASVRGLQAEVVKLDRENDRLRASVVDTLVGPDGPGGTT